MAAAVKLFGSIKLSVSFFLDAISSFLVLYALFMSCFEDNDWRVGLISSMTWLASHIKSQVSFSDIGHSRIRFVMALISFCVNALGI